MLLLVKYLHLKPARADSALYCSNIKDLLLKFLNSNSEIGIKPATNQLVSNGSNSRAEKATTSIICRSLYMFAYLRALFNLLYNYNYITFYIYIMKWIRTGNLLNSGQTE